VLRKVTLYYGDDNAYPIRARINRVSCIRINIKQKLQRSSKSILAAFPHIFMRQLSVNIIDFITCYICRVPVNFT